MMTDMRASPAPVNFAPLTGSHQIVCVCVFLETSWVRSQHILTPNLSHIEAWSRPLVVAFDA